MPYLSGFADDIFISYASVDNEPDAQDVRWVSRFRCRNCAASTAR